jgi:hypothetical protein
MVRVNTIPLWNSCKPGTKEEINLRVVGYGPFFLCYPITVGILIDVCPLTAHQVIQIEIISVKIVFYDKLLWLKIN